MNLNACFWKDKQTDKPLAQLTMKKGWKTDKLRTEEEK